MQTVFFAGGGVQGGRVIGSSDKIGGFPAANPQTPENMAATIYQALGLPRDRGLARRAGPAALRLPRRTDRRPRVIAALPFVLPVWHWHLASAIAPSRGDHLTRRRISAGYEGG